VIDQRRHRDAVADHYRRLAESYDTRANRTCEQTYVQLVRQFLNGRERVLEVGSGSNGTLERLSTSLAVACDLSVDMLRHRSSHRSLCVAAAGEALPFGDSQFDAVFMINVLEHVADPDAVLKDCARVLRDGGVCLVVTPNGNWEFWLDLAERWSLKIPEGPHKFLTVEQLRLSAGSWLEVQEHWTFLLLPAGPPALAALLDRLTFCSALKTGFFQVLAATKRSAGALPSTTGGSEGR
jgi:ubiquinone/menaquinone biosynthesis C-methylase UbiE